MRAKLMLLWCATAAMVIVGCKERPNKTTSVSSNNQPIVNPESLPREKWPDDLVHLLEALQKRQASPANIDVRYANPDEDYSGGFYWRMPANAVTVDAHLKTFHLEKTIAGENEADKIFERYPKSWPKPAAKDVTWYAWDGNRDDPAIHAHFWQIMMVDERQGILYFFYWIWDVGI